MSNETFNLLFNGTLETIYMVFVSGFIAVVGGLPLGVILLTTRREGILENKLYNKGLGFLVNVVRAIPFIILLVALVPFTRLIVGTSIGTNAAIVPLTIGAIPFVARIIENALTEVSGGLVEAGQAMGASPWQLIIKILLPEAMPGIVNGITITLIALVGYSAMAGAVGGGGLGSVAINYGYLRFNPKIMLATVIILILLVYLIQWCGDFISAWLNHKE
jgi:D-methionine transport system permease protein